MAYQNGGGVFFIPYFVMLFVCGIPIFMAELALGQYSAQGTLSVWKALPAFKVSHNYDSNYDSSIMTHLGNRLWNGLGFISGNDLL